MKTEVAIKNGQSREETGNIGHKTQDDHKLNTTQKTKKISNMNPYQKTGVEPMIPRDT